MKMEKGKKYNLQFKIFKKGFKQFKFKKIK